MDEPRVLLSRLLLIGNDKLLDLREPLFYYIAIGLTIAGVVAMIASMIGWWAACYNTYCLLSIVRIHKAFNIICMNNEIVMMT